MEDLQSVRAEIELLPASVSGKSQGYRSGFRPNHFFPGYVHSVIGVVNFVDREWLNPGERCSAVVKFIYPQ
jgi:hypothetical protein